MPVAHFDDVDESKKESKVLLVPNDSLLKALLSCLYFQSWSKIGDPVLHIELRKWADLMIIAPLDANTMAKLVNGICDNLLVSIFLHTRVADKIFWIFYLF